MTNLHSVFWAEKNDNDFNKTGFCVKISHAKVIQLFKFFPLMDLHIHAFQTLKSVENTPD